MLLKIYKRKPCSEETKRKIGLGNSGKTRTEEFKKKLSESHKGMKYSKETCLKKSLSMMGKNCGKKRTLETKEKLRKLRLGKPGYWKGKKRGHWSEEHKRKLSLANKGDKNPMYGKKRPNIMGDKNPNYKGGITLLYCQVRNSLEYRQWRSDVFTRDDFTCQDCGDKKGGNLVAHHIKPFSKILVEHNIQTMRDGINCEELWNINNGITLCKKCHKKIPVFRNFKDLTNL